MTLLDRFRGPSSQSPSDPAARLAHVEALPLDERAAIASAAREDEDPRVRRAAVKKLMDPAALAAIARDDRDDGVRAAAVAMLRDLALEAFEGAGEPEGLEAVSAMHDDRTLAQVAKAAPRETIGLLALSRLGDESRLLGSVARHALAEGVRLAALARLRAKGDRAELLAVAMRSDFKDSALGALESFPDAADLEQVADRATNKSAARRARSMLRAAEGARQREVAEAEAAVRAATLEAAERDAAARRAAADQETGAEAAAADRHAPTAPEERLASPDPAAGAIEAIDGEEAARRAAQEAEDALRRDVRLGELADAALAASVEPDLPQARQRVAAAVREWKALAQGVDVRPDLGARLAQAEADLARREAEARELDQRARREALARVRQLLARVEPLVAATDLSLKAGERALRDVRAALADLPPLPTKQDAADLTGRLQAALTGLGPRVEGLRQDTEWQRFANAVVQEQLCVRMEALGAVEDPDAIARDIKTLQDEWRAAADVPRAQAEALWRRFKAAHDAVWPRCQAHFAAQAEERAANLAKKVALCEQAESLAESTNWIAAADAIKTLQAEWKTVGPVSRGRERAMWERFRKACDRFFTRRQDDLAQRKAAWNENYARKEALCVKAEALADSTEWDVTAAAIKGLQAEWKAIGPVRKSRSEAIWQRFRAACDRFFARYAMRHDLARAERVEAREAICAELDAMAGAPLDASGAAGEAAPEPPADLPSRLREIRGRWQQEIAARGVEPARARALDERFAAAFAAVVARWPSAVAGTELDPESNRKRMDALVRRVEALAASLGNASAAGAEAALSPTTRLAAMLKEALASNTIGGKVEDDSRRRAALEEMRQAQASWSKIGPTPEEMRRPLADRFQRACRLVADRARVESR